MARTVSTVFAPFTLLLFFAGVIHAQGGLSKENLDLPYDAMSLAEEDEDSPEVIIFYGQNYEGDGVFFCLDRSSSTRNGELKIEKREAIRSITEFSSRVEFGGLSGLTVSRSKKLLPTSNVSVVWSTYLNSANKLDDSVTS